MQYGIDPQQLLDLVVRPVVAHLDLDGTQNGERLVLGTALVESHAGYLKQLGKGPALGLWQMEPATHDDIWDNFLKHDAKLSAKVFALGTSVSLTQGANELVGNLYYAAALCRVHYRRFKAPIPADSAGLAAYWKRWYNTPKGAGTAELALPHFQAACELQ